MKRNYFYLASLFMLLLCNACKKDKKNNPEPDKPQLTYAKVQVLLPDGANVDLSQLTIVGLSKSTNVNADGSADVPFNNGSHELVSVFDASDNIIMMGFISNENKQISIASTSQAMLYFGLGLTYAGSEEERIAFLNKIPTYSQFGEFKSKMEERFKSDPQMLSKNEYLSDFQKTIDAITKMSVIDTRAKLIDVEDPEKQKSGIAVQQKSGDDENIEIVNHRLRRAHAFLYRTAYKQKFDSRVTLISNFYSHTTFDNEIAVKGGMTNGGKVVTPVTTGPVQVPLRDKEVEAIWKVRIVGPGSPSSEDFTTDEANKLEELWIEFFAVDILMPNMLHVIGHANAQYALRSNNVAAAKPFIDEVKNHLTDDVMNLIKNGNFVEGLKTFQNAVEGDYYKRTPLAKKLIEVLEQIDDPSNTWKQSGQDIEDEADRQGRLTATITKLNEGVKTHVDDQIELIYNDGKTLEQWTVKVKDDDVKISPKQSQVMRYASHTLTVSADPELDGKTLEFEWTTTGNFGVLRSGSDKGTNLTTTSKSITYYPNKTLTGEDNFDKVYVTAYIKDNSGTREYYGTDTATINVKKVAVIMKPKSAELSPKKGSSAIKLYLENSDGTDPIVNSAAVQTKVEWSTSGSYGHFHGNVKEYTTNKNFITYIATDDEVKSAIENITARIYFKLNSTDWILQEEVKGQVKIDNDDSKIVYYTSSQGVHIDYGGNACSSGCVIYVPNVPNAVSYAVTDASSGSSIASWAVTGSEKRYQGFGAGLAEIATNDGYVVGIEGSWGWGFSLNPDVPVKDHRVPPACGGTFKVVVTVSK